MSDETKARASYRLIPELRAMVIRRTLVKGTHADGWQEYVIRNGPGGDAVARLHFYWGRGGKAIEVEDRVGGYFELVDGIKTQRQAAAWIKERMVRDGK